MGQPNDKQIDNIVDNNNYLLEILPMIKQMTLKKEMNSFTLLEKFIMCLFVFVPFTYLVAPFSKYYVIHNMEIYTTLFLVGLFMVRGNRLKDKINLRNAWYYFFACMIVLAIPIIVHLEYPFVTVICELFYVVSFLSLKSEYKIYIYNRFVRILSWLFLFGIIEFLLSFLGITYFIGQIERLSDSSSQVFNQGLFVIIPSYFSESSFRFMSICEEPGTVGTLSFFLIITLDKKKYTREFVIFIISGMLSLSLAFYILTAFWLVLERRTISSNFHYLVPLAVIVYFFFSIFGDFFNERIVERVSGKNIEEIDNRSSETLKKKYNEVWNNGDIIWGIGNRSYYAWQSKAGSSGAGLKKFMMQYGLIGTVILFFLFSRFFLLFNGVNKKNLIILFLFWLSFYQRSYWNNVPVFIALFSFSCEYINYKTKKYASRTNIDNKGICPAST